MHPGGHEIFLDEILDLLDMNGLPGRPLPVDIGDNALRKFLGLRPQLVREFTVVVRAKGLGDGHRDLLGFERNDPPVALDDRIKFKLRPTGRVLLAVIGIKLAGFLISAYIKLADHFILNFLNGQKFPHGKTFLQD